MRTGLTLGVSALEVLFLSHYITSVELSLCVPNALFRPGISPQFSVRWDDCGRACPGELRVGSFVWRVPTLWLYGIVKPFRLCWVMACLFNSNLPPRPFSRQNDWGILHTKMNTGVERISKQELEQKVDSGEEDIPAHSAGDWTHDLSDHESDALPMICISTVTNTLLSISLLVCYLSNLIQFSPPHLTLPNGALPDSTISLSS